MGAFINFETGVKPQPEFFEINFKTKRITGHWLRCRYIDKDTKHFVILYPSFGLSGYGNTEEEAMEMLQFSMDELFNYLMTSPLPVVLKYLKELNWTVKQPLFDKKRVFSHSYIDSEGQLKELNAAENSMEVSYQAA